MPQVVNIDEVQVGMTLSEDVINPQGLVLIKKNVELTEKHIKVMMRWGISTISVADSLDVAADGRPIAEIMQEKLTEIGLQLENRFLGCDNNEIMMDIKNCVREYRIDQIKQKFGES